MQRTYRLPLRGQINLTESARDKLLSFGKRRRFADGQTILHQGEKANGFGALISGQVIAGRHSEDGTQTLFGVAGPGDLFGELAFLAGVPRLAHTVADGDVEVVWFDGAAFRRILAADGKFSMLLMRSLAEQLMTVMERVDAERTMPVADRLAQALLAMDRHAEGEIACTQQQLADLIGVSRVTLGTALRQLERSGAIAGNYGRVRITNRAALEGRLAAAGWRPAQAA